jgi:hypothetical protein
MVYIYTHRRFGQVTLSIVIAVVAITQHLHTIIYTGGSEGGLVKSSKEWIWLLKI